MSDPDRIEERIEAFLGLLQVRVAGTIVDREVIEVPGTDTASRAALADELEERHGQAPFRLLPTDLAAAGPDRVRAAIRLLDAAALAGAPVLLDVADELAADGASVAGLSEALAAFPGVVLLALAGAGPSPYGDVVTMVAGVS